MPKVSSCNRPDILKTLIHRINSFAEGYRQNIAIIGESYTGKTFLIKTLLASGEIKKDEIIPIYLEVKIEPFEFCAKRFIKSALYQLLHSDPSLTTLHDPLLLIEDLKRIYPKTAQTCLRVLQDLERGKLEEAYSFMMDIPAAILEESKKRPVVVLDEFHRLGNFNIKHPFTVLAKKIMIQKDAMYLLLSSRNVISQRILNEKLSMLFGNFEKFILPPFDINMSRSFLGDKIKAVALPRPYLDFIAFFTGNKPLYMQIISDEIERLVFSRKVPPEDYAAIIESAMTEVIFKRTGTINQLFSSLFLKVSEGKFLSKSASVLIALSLKNRKQQEIIKNCGLQRRDVSRILNRFVEMDVIARNGSFYRFKERLFSFWLQSVYMKRLLSFSIDEDLEKESFRGAVRLSIQAFIREFEKELSLRMEDLFRSFNNDVIQLNGKKHKFVSFTEIYRLKDGLCNSINIMAKGDKLRWLCTIKEDRITENDVAEMIKILKRNKGDKKINRNILVSLTGIDENAYLIAKEARFWVWDLESLNLLMELYGKPCIFSQR